MLDRLFDIIAKLFYAKSLQVSVQETIDDRKLEAGNYAAARYTRGNVAIQQQRINNRKLPS
ncbi:hypothetical protein C8J34_12231 [Rhizobium sp. PP-F2F-G36]|nr:hypothetical protein C8J34_12231 [Rhizobium sp. PP-F2F-G36]